MKVVSSYKKRTKKILVLKIIDCDELRPRTGSKEFEGYKVINKFT
jgi:hypothetical protein